MGNVVSLCCAKPTVFPDSPDRQVASAGQVTQDVFILPSDD